MRKIVGLLFVLLFVSIPIFAKVGSVELLGVDTLAGAESVTYYYKLPDAELADTNYLRFGVVSWGFDAGTDSVKAAITVAYGNDTTVASNPLQMWSGTTTLAAAHTTSDSTALTVLAGYPDYAEFFDWVAITITGDGTDNDQDNGSLWWTYAVKKNPDVEDYP